MDAPEREYEGFTLKYTPVSRPIAGAGTTVIKVYFDRNTHNVNYVDNGANAPIASETHRYGENFIPKVPTKTGYGFAGWFVDEELTEAFDAGKAIKKDTGARALRSIIEEFMLDIMYEIPKDDNIGQVTITKEYIEGTGGPLISLRGQHRITG